MMYKEIEKEYLTCPYNPSHEVQRLRIQAHILKCKKNYPDVQLDTCYYNYRHKVRREDMSKHLETCLDKIRLEGSRYRDQSVTASTSTFVVDEDDCDKTESVISFGSDFKKCLPDDTSTVSSRSSVPLANITRRGNALLKMGPRGNLSRYAMNKRKTELQDKELKYLESYDGLESYKPTTSDEEDDRFRVTLKKKEDSDEDMEPLPLPKTSSKAFVSLKRSLEEPKSNVFKENTLNKNEGSDKKHKSGSLGKMKCVLNYEEYLLANKINVPEEKNRNKSDGSDKKHKSENVRKSKYVLEYEKEYGTEAEKDHLEFIASFEAKREKRKQMTYAQWKSENPASLIVGRGHWPKTNQAESNRRPGKQKQRSLLPDVSDLDDEVPKRKPKKNVLNTSELADTGNSSDESNSIISELGNYAELYQNSFRKYRDHFGEDSSDTETIVSSSTYCGSLIAKEKAPKPRRKHIDDGETYEATNVLNASLGRGFPFLQKKDTVKPFRGIGRGVLLQ